MVVVALSITGVINRTRAVLAGRRGTRFLQHIYNVRLLLRKGAVYSPTTTALFRIAPCVYLGAAIMAFGIMIESLADWQKSKAKAKNPSRFCDSGLYKIVRCPNYLGEVLFWTGVFVSGTSILNGVWQWIAASLGYVCIVYIMFGGARRLEIRQNRNYGTDPEYQAYVKKMPILIPLIPLYSVEKYKWLVG